MKSPVDVTPRYLRVPQAAAYLSLAPKTLYRLAMDLLMLDRLWNDEDLCWRFFLEFAHRQLASREAVINALADLSEEPIEGERMPWFSLKEVLVAVRHRWKSGSSA